MKLLTLISIIALILLLTYLIRKIFFLKKNDNRIFDGEFEEIDENENKR